MNIIEIKEDIQIGDIILEKGDKIEVLQESQILPIHQRAWLKDWARRTSDDPYEQGVNLGSAIIDFINRTGKVNPEFEQGFYQVMKKL